MNSYVFLTIRKGRKDYFATVSSFSYSGRDLWLFIWGKDGNCGYIPNGRVIAASISTWNHPSVSAETVKIIHGW